MSNSNPRADFSAPPTEHPQAGGKRLPWRRWQVAAALAVLACPRPNEPADVSLTLPPAALAAGARVRVVPAEPPLAPELVGRRPRYARLPAPFVEVSEGRRRGEVLLRGVPAGDAAIVADWPGRAAPGDRVWHVALADVEVLPGSRLALGALRVAAGATASVCLRIVEEGRRGRAEVSQLALVRDTALPFEVVPVRPKTAITPVLRFDVQIGGTTRIDGVTARRLDLLRQIGPEHLAPGWVLGPASRTDGARSVEVTALVARASEVRLAFTEAPPATHEVRVWARRDEARGVWLAPTADLAPAEGGRFVGTLALSPGAWRLLAQAVDAEGRPSGATAAYELAVEAGGASLTAALRPSATLVVRGERRDVGAQVAVRPAGWTVELDACPMAASGEVRLEGLLADAPHDLVSGDVVRRVHAAAPGGTRSAPFPGARIR